MTSHPSTSTDTHGREAEARARALAEGIGGKVSQESSGEWLVFVGNGDASLCFAFDEFSTPHNPVFGWSVFDEQGVQIRAAEPVVPHLTAHDMDACIAKAKAIIAAEMTDTTDTATTEERELNAIANGIGVPYVTEFSAVHNSGGGTLVIPVRRETWSIEFSFVSGTLGWNAVSHATDEEPDFADGILLDDGGADLDSSETTACIAYCNKVIAEQDSKRKDLDWWIGENV